MSFTSKIRAAAFVSLVWGLFFGVAGILVMNGGFFLTDSVLGVRDFMLVAVQAFIRFGVIGAAMGAVFAVGIAIAQLLLPKDALTGGRAALLGAVCAALGGSAILTQLFGLSLTWLAVGGIATLGAGLGAAMVGSANRSQIAPAESPTRIAP